MKIRVTFKTPDAVGDELANEAIPAKDKAAFRAMVKKFVEYEECVTIVFDTETRQVTVEPI